MPPPLRCQRNISSSKKLAMKSLFHVSCTRATFALTVLLRGRGSPQGLITSQVTGMGRKVSPQTLMGTAGWGISPHWDRDMEPSPDGEFPIAISNSSAILCFVYCKKTNQLTHVNAKKTCGVFLADPSYEVFDYFLYVLLYICSFIF